jgi:DNA helicase HerA-like ATPase
MFQRARRMIEETGRTLVIVDPARVPTWRYVPHAKSLTDCVRRAWSGKHVAFDASPSDLEGLCRAARAGKDIILAIDELRPYASSHVVGDDLVILARQHRHCRVDLLLGTQSIGDVRTDLLAAVDTVYTGRVTSPRLLDFLKREWGLDPSRVQALDRGEWIETRMGFVGD